MHQHTHRDYIPCAPRPHCHTHNFPRCPSLRYVTVDEENVVSSTRVLSLSKIPKRAVVIGASYIGLEVGSVWARLGSKVTVVDPAPVIVPSMDGGVWKKFQLILVKQKLKFMLETEVVEVDTSSSSAVKLTIQPTSGDQKSMIETDVVLASEYSVPNTAGLVLRWLVLRLMLTRGIKIDERFMMNIPHVYAIGDVATPRSMLAAHKAAMDGAECVRIIAGKEDILPDTHPEAATIGMAEEQAKATGVSYGTFKTRC